MNGSISPEGRPNGHKTWTIFLGVGLVIEVYALASRGKHMSLSEFTRDRLGQHPRRSDKSIWAIVLTAVLTWFLGHIVAGWGPSLTEDHHLTWRSIYHVPSYVVEAATTVGPTGQDNSDQEVFDI